MTAAYEAASKAQPKDLHLLHNLFCAYVRSVTTSRCMFLTGWMRYRHTCMLVTLRLMTCSLSRLMYFCVTSLSSRWPVHHCLTRGDAAQLAEGGLQ